MIPTPGRGEANAAAAAANVAAHKKARDDIRKSRKLNTCTHQETVLEENLENTVPRNTPGKDVRTKVLLETNSARAVELRINILRTSQIEVGHNLVVPRKNGVRTERQIIEKPIWAAAIHQTDAEFVEMEGTAERGEESLGDDGNRNLGEGNQNSLGEMMPAMVRKKSEGTSERTVEQKVA
jgi:hypothetical protein